MPKDPRKLRLHDEPEDKAKAAEQPPVLPIMFSAAAVDAINRLKARTAAKTRAREHASSSPALDRPVRGYDQPETWDVQVDELYSSVYAAMRWLLLGPDAAVHIAAQHITTELFGSGWRKPSRG